MKYQQVIDLIAVIERDTIRKHSGNNSLSDLENKCLKRIDELSEKAKNSTNSLKGGNPFDDIEDDDEIETGYGGIDNYLKFRNGFGVSGYEVTSWESVIRFLSEENDLSDRLENKNNIAFSYCNNYKFIDVFLKLKTSLLNYMVFFKEFDFLGAFIEPYSQYMAHLRNCQIVGEDLFSVTDCLSDTERQSFVYNFIVLKVCRMKIIFNNYEERTGVKVFDSFFLYSLAFNIWFFESLKKNKFGLSISKENSGPLGCNESLGFDGDNLLPVFKKNVEPIPVYPLIWIEDYNLIDDAYNIKGRLALKNVKVAYFIKVAGVFRRSFEYIHISTKSDGKRDKEVRKAFLPLVNSQMVKDLPENKDECFSYDEKFLISQHFAITHHYFAKENKCSEYSMFEPFLNSKVFKTNFTTDIVSKDLRVLDDKIFNLNDDNFEKLTLLRLNGESEFGLTSIIG